MWQKLFSAKYSTIEYVLSTKQLNETLFELIEVLPRVQVATNQNCNEQGMFLHIKKLQEITIHLFS